MFYSPLRYPGGKNKLSAYIAFIANGNDIKRNYVEVYAGGASVALFLLMEGYVKNILINDKDRSIYAFWYSVLNKSEELIARIKNTEVNIENWRIQKSIQQKKDKVNLLDLGFSTLFLNRTNRSGIINGGMIGGVDQSGNYKIDCRFNKVEIISRIKEIAKLKKHITLKNYDALDLIDYISERDKFNNALIYFDPPYYLKADSLYMNYYKHNDHILVYDKINSIEDLYWIVSYDNHEAIKNLYHDYRSIEFSFKHTAYESREGKEIIFFSDNLNIPTNKKYNPVNYKYSASRKQDKIFYKAS